MTERQNLLKSIASTAADYRADELAAISPEHINHWITQFDAAVQMPILREMDYTLKSTYFSLSRVTAFLRGLLQTDNLAGTAPCTFWRGAQFLDIQGDGNSQTDMLALFDEVLQEKCGFGIEQSNRGGAIYVYLDDAIFTGNRVRRDLENWIAEQAPARAQVHVISIALHSGAQYYAHERINRAAAAAGKIIDVRWWRAITLENQKTRSYLADVLWPTTIPDDAAVQAYVQTMQHDPVLRRPGSVGSNALYSSQEGKHLLEQEFLKAGAKIRQMCPYLTKVQRPLGHVTLDTLGFGSLIVTFRNCPNNAPLALWAGDPWYPLFPRTTNRQAEVRRLFKRLKKDGRP